MGKYVYIIYDPLYEKVLCVHDKPNKYCDICRPIAKRLSPYPLEEKKRKVKTTGRASKLFTEKEVKNLFTKFCNDVIVPTVLASEFTREDLNNWTKNNL